MARDISVYGPYAFLAVWPGDIARPLRVIDLPFEDLALRGIEPILTL